MKLLASRSGARASQGAFCLLILSFGTLCATSQIVTMRCMDLHSFWKVYVRTPLGFCPIPINSRPSYKGYPGEFHWISVDLCPPWDCIGFRLICVYFERAIPWDFIILFAIHGTSKTCLDATPLDQGCDGTELKYFANCNEGSGAAGSAWCP